MRFSPTPTSRTWTPSSCTTPRPPSVNLGGWYLTDDIATPRKYRIPNGTTIHRQRLRDVRCEPVRLRLSPLRVRRVRLAPVRRHQHQSHRLLHRPGLSRIPQRRLLRALPQQPDQRAFRAAKCQDPQRAQRAIRAWDPIVISEIMYHPPDLPDGSDDDLNEFIELQNITGTDVPLYCIFTNEPGYGAAALTNTWRLRNAVDFDFPTNQSSPPGRVCWWWVSIRRPTPRSWPPSARSTVCRRTCPSSARGRASSTTRRRPSS